MEKRSWWDTAFALFGRAIIGGPLGGTLMIAYAMANTHVHGGDVWVPMRAIGATFLGDKGVDDPSFRVEGAVLGGVIHATNSVIFALILALIVAAVLGRAVLSWRTLVALTLVGGVAYALTLMVVMQNVVVPVADPAFAEYTTSQAQFTLEHVIFGLVVSAVLATTWRVHRLDSPSTRQPSPASPRALRS